jgi:hypothetical protein
MRREEGVKESRIGDALQEQPSWASRAAAGVAPTGLVQIEHERVCKEGQASVMEMPPPSGHGGL